MGTIEKKRLNTMLKAALSTTLISRIRGKNAQLAMKPGMKKTRENPAAALTTSIINIALFLVIYSINTIFLGFKMRISVVGAGYVGLVTGTCLSEAGHEVVLVDVDHRKVSRINRRESPIYEEGLDAILQEKVGAGLTATSKLYTAVSETDATFICVGTPSSEDGSVDLSYVEKSSNDIGKILKDKKDFHVVIVKSTVVPGTTEDIVLPILERESGKTRGADFGVAMNPEFLREGRAVEDFRHPDRIVIGCMDEKTRKLVTDIYSTHTCPVMHTCPRTAEMIKYASNSFLAAKLSFINEVGNICKKMGVNVYEVAEGMGFDERISPSFLNAGPGFGGSCFPKDVLALISMARRVGEEPLMLENLLEVNEKQPQKVVELVKSRMEIEGKTIGVLGLAFKAGTDDVRSSPAISVVKHLISEGAQVTAYDPKAIQNAKRALGPAIKYAKTAQEVLSSCDATVILTEWEEFKKLDYSKMKGMYLFDTRRIVSKNNLPKDVIYEGLCW